jgi:hypothetical protein
MHVALCEENRQAVIGVTNAEYKGLLGYIASHCDFGLTPESVRAAWVQDNLRVTRDVFQFALDHATDRLSKAHCELMLLLCNHEDIAPCFVVIREYIRPILGLIPGVSKVGYGYDDCPTQDELKLIAAGIPIPA